MELQLSTGIAYEMVEDLCGFCLHWTDGFKKEEPMEATYAYRGQKLCHDCAKHLVDIGIITHTAKLLKINEDVQTCPNCTKMSLTKARTEAGDVVLMCTNCQYTQLGKSSERVAGIKAGVDKHIKG